MKQEGAQDVFGKETPPLDRRCNRMPSPAEHTSELIGCRLDLHGIVRV